MKSKINSKIIKIIYKHINLFSYFNSVYLFGSALYVNKIPNDIDILLIYQRYSNKINEELEIISSVLENACELPVDLTVLSIREERDTEFLKRINYKCFKIK